ncbi:UNKNOWN [Stylonychia lemnae]|uniref:Uncharacterized protein n=1 Tax=Stylonychia lemnae TaxID=5949 RepID=A0A078A356_STYLE|nr:UNKNOWN [Stylonychia lemnae]|eukprot:CDW75933.1 UNKNOWN [Stylonychia lemnae]
MLHYTVLNLLGSGYEKVTAPLVAVPSDQSIFLRYVRNIALVFSYFILHIFTIPAFWVAQLFFDDGQLFLQFWSQILQLVPLD